MGARKAQLKTEANFVRAGIHPMRLMATNLFMMFTSLFRVQWSVGFNVWIAIRGGSIGRRYRSRFGRYRYQKPIRSHEPLWL